MQSFRNRFKGREDEVRQTVKYHGQFKAPRLLGLKGWSPAFQNYVEEITGNRNFGINPMLPSTTLPDGQDGISFVFGKLADCVVDLRTQLAAKDKIMDKKDERIRELEWQLAAFKQEQEGELARGMERVLEACKA